MRPTLLIVAAGLVVVTVCRIYASEVRPIMIVALGDSTTAGTPFFSSPLEVPPDGSGDPEGQYAFWMMRRRPQWKVINQGIRGQTSTFIRARLPDALKLGPRYIVI